MNDWSFWKAALGGEKPPVREGDIRSGYWRTAKFEPVATYQTDAGVWVAIRGKKEVDDEIAIADLFIQVCHLPIPYDDWLKADGERMIVNAGPSNNAPEEAGADPLVTHTAALQELQERTALFLTDGTIAFQEQADAWANAKAQVVTLKQAIEAAFQVEKEPWRIGGNAVDERWRWLKAEAETFRKSSLMRVEAWLKAKKAAAEAIAAAPVPEGVTATVPAKAPAKVKAGQNRTVSLMQHDEVVWTDISAAAAHLASLPGLQNDFKAFMRTFVLRQRAAGFPTPGTKIETTEKAR